MVGGGGGGFHESSCQGWVLSRSKFIWDWETVFACPLLAMGSIKSLVLTHYGWVVVHDRHFSFVIRVLIFGLVIKSLLF